LDRELTDPLTAAGRARRSARAECCNRNGARGLWMFSWHRLQTFSRQG